MTQSCSARRSTGSSWSASGDRRQPLEPAPQVVAEEPGEAAEERRRVRIARPDPVASRAEQPPGVRERVGPSEGASMTATGSAVRYVQRAFRPGRALSRRTSPGQVAEPLGDVHRGVRRELRQLDQPDARRRAPVRARSRGSCHRRIISAGSCSASACHADTTDP